MSIVRRLPSRLAAASLMALVLAGPAATAHAAARPTPSHAERRAAVQERIAERRAAIAARILVVGTLTAVDLEARTVTVAVDAGRPTDLVGVTETFSLTEDALIARDEAVVTLDAFQVGDHILVSGTTTADGRVTDRVHASSPEPEPQPEPDPDTEPAPPVEDGGTL